MHHAVVKKNVDSIHRQTNTHVERERERGRVSEKRGGQLDTDKAKKAPQRLLHFQLRYAMSALLLQLVPLCHLPLATRVKNNSERHKSLGSLKTKDSEV